MTDTIDRLRVLRDKISEGVMTRESAEAVRLLIDVVTSPDVPTNAPTKPERKAKT